MPAETSHQNGHAAVDVRRALKEGIARLREAGVSSFTLTAEVLLMHATERDRTWLFAHPEQILDAAAVQTYFALIERRAAGEPTQYLTGKQEFWGLEFQVAPGVLIPRPETEHVMEVVLARLGERVRQTVLLVEGGVDRVDGQADLLLHLGAQHFFQGRAPGRRQLGRRAVEIDRPTAGN